MKTMNKLERSYLTTHAYNVDILPETRRSFFLVKHDNNCICGCFDDLYMATVEAEKLGFPVDIIEGPTDLYGAVACRVRRGAVAEYDDVEVIDHAWSIEDLYPFHRGERGIQYVEVVNA